MRFRTSPVTLIAQPAFGAALHRLFESLFIIRAQDSQPRIVILRHMFSLNSNVFWLFSRVKYHLYQGSIYPLRLQRLPE